MWKSCSVPVIQVLKWKNSETKEIKYDLYLNGKLSSRYTSLASLMPALEDIIGLAGEQNVDSGK